MTTTNALFHFKTCMYPLFYHFKNFFTLLTLLKIFLTFKPNTVLEFLKKNRLQSFTINFLPLKIATEAGMMLNNKQNKFCHFKPNKLLFLKCFCTIYRLPADTLVFSVSKNIVYHNCLFSFHYFYI